MSEPVTFHRVYRFRLRSKRKAEAALRRWARCSRKVWNLALAEQQAGRERGEKYAGFAGMCQWVAAWRKAPETAYLAEAPMHVLQNVVRALDGAFQRLFRKEGGYPKFKLVKRSPVMLIVSGLFFSALISQSAHAALTGFVVGVSDGDTLTVLDGTKRQRRIRLAGIDAPEKRQAFGARSSQSLSELCYGKQAQVFDTTDDRYGRTVGTVICDGVDANAAQVERGMAWVYRQYVPKRSSLYGLEAEARRERVGLWQDTEPIEPWAFRRANR